MGESQFRAISPKGVSHRRNCQRRRKRPREEATGTSKGPPIGRGHPPSLISTHKASIIVTALSCPLSVVSCALLLRRDHDVGVVEDQRTTDN